jgi:hypothetical protein
VLFKISFTLAASALVHLKRGVENVQIVLCHPHLVRTRVDGRKRTMEHQRIIDAGHASLHNLFDPIIILALVHGIHVGEKRHHQE